MNTNARMRPVRDAREPSSELPPEFVVVGVEHETSEQVALESRRKMTCKVEMVRDSRECAEKVTLILEKLMEAGASWARDEVVDSGRETDVVATSVSVVWDVGTAA